MTSAFLSVALLVGLSFHLVHLVRRSRAKAAALLAADLFSISAVVDDVRNVSDGTAGVVTFDGTWQGHAVQIRTIVDTLATRKLPAFWMSVTVSGETRIPATFDMMMRPASVTTFSNFDFLQHTLDTPANFPEGAVVRTEKAGVVLPLELIARHLAVFEDGRTKELLITRNGVRLVWLLAEADRARYGVFRQAEFSGARIDPNVVSGLLTELSDLRTAINRQAFEVAA
jgi:hypothetical protein